MNRVRLAIVALCIVLLIVFFNYIYVSSVRTEMLEQIDEFRTLSPAAAPLEQAEKTWKSRKRLLALSVPLTALDKIDIQFSELRACVQTQDRSGYVRACYHLHDLIAVLGD